MALSRLYTNQDDKFVPLEFRAGLNVVLAEIRLSENRERDTHNLGKTTLGRILDFCFLSKRDKRFFLFAQQDLFSSFVFHLELSLADGSYVTVRRSVETSSKVSFKRHPTSRRFDDFPEGGWDHRDVPFDNAKQLLDSYLGWDGLEPWAYRNGLGYVLRTQDDFSDAFQLQKFVGSHSEWKPLLAHLLGFDHKLVTDQYEKRSELETLRTKEDTLKAEAGDLSDPSAVDGELFIKNTALGVKEVQLRAFDFSVIDRELTAHLVDNIDREIAAANQRRYVLSANRRKIEASLGEATVLFEPEKARRLFEEAGVLLGEQIVRDYDQLIAFNKALTSERRGYLIEERDDIDREMAELESTIARDTESRKTTLSRLGDTDIFVKYRKTSDEVAGLKADIIALERRRESYAKLSALRTEIRKLVADLTELHSKIEKSVAARSAATEGTFASVRMYFNEIMHSVTGSSAILSVVVNKEGNLEFNAKLLGSGGQRSDADKGFTYRKIICIAFDLAVLRAHLGVGFPRFVFHDGAFEAADDRTKGKLLDVYRQYNALGIQTVVTLIDSDLPGRDTDEPAFDPSEIVLVLHDEGEDGLLFKMPAW